MKRIFVFRNKIFATSYINIFSTNKKRIFKETSTLKFLKIFQRKNGRSLYLSSQRCARYEEYYIYIYFQGSSNLSRHFNSIRRGVKAIFKRRSIDHDQDSFSWTDKEKGYRLVANLT